MLTVNSAWTRKLLLEQMYGRVMYRQALDAYRYVYG